MFAKSKIVRFTLGACLTAASLSLGDGLLQPTQASAMEIIRSGPIVRDEVIVRRPVVTVDPVVQVGPVVTTGPIYEHPGYWHYGYHYGFHWHR